MIEDKEKEKLKKVFKKAYASFLEHNIHGTTNVTNFVVNWIIKNIVILENSRIGLRKVKEEPKGAINIVVKKGIECPYCREKNTKLHEDGIWRCPGCQNRWGGSQDIKGT